MSDWSGNRWIQHFIRLERATRQKVLHTTVGKATVQRCADIEGQQLVHQQLKRDNSDKKHISLDEQMAKQSNRLGK